MHINLLKNKIPSNGPSMLYFNAMFLVGYRECYICDQLGYKSESTWEKRRRSNKFNEVTYHMRFKKLTLAETSRNIYEVLRNPKNWGKDLETILELAGHKRTEYAV